ncbi:MAG: hypothetical protein MRY74_00930 [Neomegalonema sp.]|nr:hypothetical protein [Neomegalonema sp.]
MIRIVKIRARLSAALAALTLCGASGGAIAQSPAPGGTAADILRSACVKPLGNLVAASSVLRSAGFVETVKEADVTVYTRETMTVLLASKAAPGARPKTQCTLLISGMLAAEADALAMAALAAAGYATRRETKSGQSTIRYFGSRDAGFSAPDLGAVVTLPAAFATEIVQTPASGVSVLTQSNF